MTAEPSTEFTDEPTTTREYQVRLWISPIMERDAAIDMRAACLEMVRRQLVDNLPGADIVDGPREVARYPVNCPPMLRDFPPEEIERILRRSPVESDNPIDLDAPWCVVYQATMRVPLSLLSEGKDTWPYYPRASSKPN